MLISKHKVGKIIHNFIMLLTRLKFIDNTRDVVRHFRRNPFKLLVSGALPPINLKKYCEASLSISMIDGVEGL